MNIAGFIEESLVDGEGIRSVVFISGCKHKCRGCHNPSTHNFNCGVEFTIEKQLEVINKIKSNPLIDGITISGGDPFFSAKEVNKFVRLLKHHIPNINIWIYSGFKFEQIFNGNDSYMVQLLMSCDVLVDGRFEIEDRNLDLKFRGSNNQRIIDIKSSFNNGYITLFKED